MKTIKIKDIKVLVVIASVMVLLLTFVVFKSGDSVTTEIAVNNEVYEQSGSTACTSYNVRGQYGQSTSEFYTSATRLWASAYITTSSCSPEPLATFCLDAGYLDPGGNPYKLDRVLTDENPFDRAIISLYQQVQTRGLSIGTHNIVDDAIVNTVARLLTYHYDTAKSASGATYKVYVEPFRCTAEAFDKASTYAEAKANSSCAQVITASNAANMETIFNMYKEAIRASEANEVVVEGAEFTGIDIQINDTATHINRVISGSVTGGSIGDISVTCEGGISCSASTSGTSFSVTVTGAISGISDSGAKVVVAAKNTGTTSYNSAMILSPVRNTSSYQRMIVFGAADIIKEFEIAAPGDACLETNFDTNFCTSTSVHEMYATELEKYGQVDYLTCLTDDGEAGTQKDAAGNSLNVLPNNPYCSINCGEDWSFSVPGQINDVIAGTYFSMATTMQGSKVCASVVNFDLFDSDYDRFMRTLASQYTDYLRTKAANSVEPIDHAITCLNPNYDSDDEDSVKEIPVNVERIYAGYDVYSYNPTTQQIYKSSRAYYELKGNCDSPSITPPSEDSTYQGTITAIENAIKNINACSPNPGQFALEFDPLLSYNYEETYYMEKIIGGNNYYISTTGSVSPGVNAKYTTGSEVNNDYSNLNLTDIPKTVYNSPDCGDSGCKTVNVDVATTTYALYESSSEKILFKPYTVFWTNHPTGEMSGTALDHDDVTTESGVVTKLGRVYPVSLTTGQGTYQYNFVYNNIGEYYNGSRGGTVGRLMNYSGHLVTVNRSKVQNDEPGVVDTVATSSYSCNYNVIEDICKCCDDTPLSFQDGDGNIVGWAGNGQAYLNYYYRPTSLNQLFGEEFLDNGDVSGEIVNWSTTKGQLVYDNINDQKEEAYITPEYSYLLTPETLSQIRAYNDEAESGDGAGFADFSMNCNEYGYNCSSTFLDELGSSSNKFDDGIELNRPDDTKPVEVSTFEELSKLDTTTIRWVNYSGGEDHSSSDLDQSWDLTYVLPETTSPEYVPGKAMK